MSSRTAPGPAGAEADPVRSALEANGRLFGVALVFSAAMSILALTTSFYMLEVYDRVLTSRSAATLVLLSIIATIAIAVFSTLDSLRLRLLVRAGMRVAAALAPRSCGRWSPSPHATPPARSQGRACAMSTRCAGSSAAPVSRRCSMRPSCSCFLWSFSTCTGRISRSFWSAELFLQRSPAWISC